MKSKVRASPISNRLTVMINLIWQIGHANLNEKILESFVKYNTESIST